MGVLTTHVLDTAQGCPAAGVSVSLYSLDGERLLLSQNKTNGDGRLDNPLLEGSAFEVGTYELVFQAGDYFAQSDLALDSPAFVNEVVLRFSIARDEHYHVPLLVSPWSYSTYRGS